MREICASIRFRLGCEATDPRDGRLRLQFTADDTLRIEVDGETVYLIAPERTVIAPFSASCGAVLVPPTPETTAPAVKPDVKKAKRPSNVDA